MPLFCWSFHFILAHNIIDLLVFCCDWHIYIYNRIKQNHWELSTIQAFVPLLVVRKMIIECIPAYKHSCTTLWLWSTVFNKVKHNDTTCWVSVRGSSPHCTNIGLLSGYLLRIPCDINPMVDLLGYRLQCLPSIEPPQVQCCVFTEYYNLRNREKTWSSSPQV